MKRSIRFVSVLILTAACILLGGRFWPLDKVAEGIVKSVDANQLVIVQESKEGAHIWELTFEVNNDTELKKIEAINYLAAGDQIKVKYQEKEERYVATIITKVKVDRSLDQRTSLDI